MAYATFVVALGLLNYSEEHGWAEVDIQNLVVFMIGVVFLVALFRLLLFIIIVRDYFTGEKYVAFLELTRLFGKK